MKRIEFAIETIPKAQGRPKFARIGKGVRTYDPAASRDYKADIKYQMLGKLAMMNFQIIEGPVTLSVEFYMPRPKSHYNKKGIKDLAPVWHSNKPDLDNMLKAVKDAITSTGRIWKDDSQVCSEHANKMYAEMPGIVITIQELA